MPCKLRNVFLLSMGGKKKKTEIKTTQKYQLSLRVPHVWGLPWWSSG